MTADDLLQMQADMRAEQFAAHQRQAQIAQHPHAIMAQQAHAHAVAVVTPMVTAWVDAARAAKAAAPK